MHIHPCAALIYLCTQDRAPSVEHHHADDTAAHDHRHQEDHHHTQLKGDTFGQKTGVDEFYFGKKKEGRQFFVRFRR